METFDIIKNKAIESGKGTPKPLTRTYNESGGNIHNLNVAIGDHGDYIILMFLDRINEKMLTDEFWTINEMQRLNEIKKCLPEVFEAYQDEIRS